MTEEPVKPLKILIVGEPHVGIDIPRLAREVGVEVIQTAHEELEGIKGHDFDAVFVDESLELQGRLLEHINSLDEAVLNMRDPTEAEMLQILDSGFADALENAVYLDPITRISSGGVKKRSLSRGEKAVRRKQRGY